VLFACARRSRCLCSLTPDLESEGVEILVGVGYECGQQFECESISGLVTAHGDMVWYRKSMPIADLLVWARALMCERSMDRREGVRHVGCGLI
jgi:hypothetical protein